MRDDGRGSLRIDEMLQALRMARCRSGLRLVATAMCRLMARHDLRAGEAVSPEHREQRKGHHCGTGEFPHQALIYRVAEKRATEIRMLLTVTVRFAERILALGTDDGVRPGVGSLVSSRQAAKRHENYEIRSERVPCFGSPVLPTRFTEITEPLAGAEITCTRIEPWGTASWTSPLTSLGSIA